jgi:hypothetical protein
MSEVIQRNAEEVHEVATSLGMEAFLPEPNEIQVDLDKDAKLHAGILQLLNDNGLPLSVGLTTISKSGNKHVYLTANRSLSDSERIILQACLGSDPVREVLSMIRIACGSTAPTALFEKKTQAARVKLWKKRVKEEQEIML